MLKISKYPYSMHSNCCHVYILYAIFKKFSSIQQKSPDILECRCQKMYSDTDLKNRTIITVANLVSINSKSFP